jgi:cell division protein FtsN
MTHRALPRSRLGNLIPALVESQALVALVPATGDLGWAAHAVWDVARAAVHEGRRVALVDLWIEEPRLHEVVGCTPSDGIVDAFEYGVSLSKAAHQVDGVFFIAAGSYTPSRGELFGHDRWKKLQAGFRSEGALLLLYLSAGALARLSAVPDGLLVLAPDGFEPESSIGQGILATMERGIPLLGVVRERWTPPPAQAPPEPAPAGRGRASGEVGLPRPAQRPRRRAARPVVVVATLAAGAAGGWGLLARDTRQPRVVPPPTPPAVSRAQAPAPPRADTLAWTVQLAAYGTLSKALGLADRLTAAEGVGAFVTPVPLGRGTVWYRVLAGPYPTRDSAAAARVALWLRGTVPNGQGDLLRAPYSLALRSISDLDSLRRHGIPAFRAGRGPTLVGAFESPEQASLLQAQLARAGIQATLITRVETTP